MPFKWWGLIGGVIAADEEALEQALRSQGEPGAVVPGVTVEACSQVGGRNPGNLRRWIGLRARPILQQFLPDSCLLPCCWRAFCCKRQFGSIQKRMLKQGEGMEQAG